MKFNDLVTAVAQQKLIIIGLLLIITGNGFELIFLKINIDVVIANIGALLLVAGTVEWVFDETARRELFYEWAKSIRGDDRMHRYGLMDCVLNTKEIDDPEEWLRSENFIIGIHYSSRFVEEIVEVIQERIKNKRKTVICHLEQSTLASQYLYESKSGLANAENRIEYLKNFVRSEFQGSEYVELIKHDRVLRYTVIYTDSHVWIKFFTNTKGRAKVPGIKIKSNTELFDFFQKDIEKLSGLK